MEVFKKFVGVVFYTATSAVTFVCVSKLCEKVMNDPTTMNKVKGKVTDIKDKIKEKNDKKEDKIKDDLISKSMDTILEQEEEIKNLKDKIKEMEKERG